MTNVVFYMRDHCRLCDETEVLLDTLSHHYSFKVEKRNIDSNDEWFERYHIIIPVLKIGEISLNCNTVDMHSIEKALKNASESE